VDPNAPSEAVSYWINEQDRTGGTSWYGPMAVAPTVSGNRAVLSPVLPNPVVGKAQLAYTLAKASHVVLSVHDISGKQVALLVNDTEDAGRHELTWTPATTERGRLAAPATQDRSGLDRLETRGHNPVVIEVRGLHKVFGDVAAVRDVSFTVPEGELLVLVGGSGSGKTTTLKMLNRLIEPTSGTVLLEGQDARTLPAPLLRRRIGYVFQKVGLFPHLTVAENISVPLKLLGWPTIEIRDRVNELLDLVELDRSLGGRRPQALSGGQEQRVGVARGLAARPRIMLLDEPFGALDPLIRDRLQQSFLTLRKTLGLTGVFVTHDMAEALLLADRIGVMHEGALVQIGTPRALLTSPANEYVERLLDTPRRQARTFDALAGSSS
jgi:osmoprotectant transport system ATP-binding protein